MLLERQVRQNNNKDTRKLQKENTKEKSKTQKQLLPEKVLIELYEKLDTEFKSEFKN